jgi:hypothetical protein
MWPKVVRSLIALVAGLALAVLCVRAWLGPLDYGRVHVHSPLTAEGAFGVCVVALMLFGRSGAEVAPVRSNFGIGAPLLPLAAALCLVVVIFWRNLHDPFLSDDYVIVRHASMELGKIARAFYTPGGDGGFRPIGAIYFDVVSAWSGWEPWRWHLCGLGLHVLNCGLLYFLIWSLWRNALVAMCAAVLFGLHGTRPEVVTWTAGNFDSLAACFVLAALLCVFRSRPDRLSLRLLGFANAFLILAILSKESAYAAPVLLLGFAIAADRFTEPPVRKGLLSMALVAVALFIYRWWLFGGPGGYVDPATGRPMILGLRLLPTLKALCIRLWSILFFPFNWRAPGTELLLPAVFLVSAAVFFLAYTQINSRRVVGTLLLTTAVALMPAIHIALIDDDALGSRILYLPSLGFCVLWAYVLGSVDSRGVRNAALAAMIAGSGLGLLHNLRAWHEVAMVADQTCAQAPARAPRTLEGVFFFANGLPECVSMKREENGR